MELCPSEIIEYLLSVLELGSGDMAKREGRFGEIGAAIDDGPAAAGVGGSSKVGLNDCLPRSRER